MDLPPQQQPQYVPAKPSGWGCFGAGCLTLLVAGFFGLALLIGCGWFFFHKAIANFTSSQPAEVALAQPSEAEYSAAKTKLDQFRGALRNEQAETFTFTAAELNTLVARHPDFAPRKGKMRFAIADSIATVEMSVPLATAELPMVKHRWFNGSANFGFIYADEGFRFDANWIEANGHRISSAFLSYGADSFSRSFTRGFKDGIAKHGGGEFWGNVKTMTLDGDKLVIITRGS